MNASQKGYFFKYYALFLEILDSSLSKGDWRKVPQSKRRIINPAALVERIYAFFKAWDTEGCTLKATQCWLSAAKHRSPLGDKDQFLDTERGNGNAMTKFEGIAVHPACTTTNSPDP